ncbi:MAG: hypothetical protein AAF468_20700 [Pseudomonadota bacterium]
MTKKAFWKSKMLWFNTASTLVFIGSMPEMFNLIAPENHWMLYGVTVTGNVLLRLVTKSGVALTDA